MVTVNNSNGGLNVQWTFVHTGGIELNTISVVCKELNTGQELMEINTCSSMMECTVEDTEFSTESCYC